MSFADIKMQDKAIGFIRSSMSSGRLPHSMLFVGPESVGKKLAAVTLAKALHCGRKGPSDCCDVCASCGDIAAFSHPDVYRVAPEGAANRIKIAKTRYIRERMGLRPFGRGCKVFLVEDAHLLADEAANSMLKTLEEPPSDSYIVLIADDVNKVLPTIRSRCQWVVFSAAGSAEVERFLKGAHGAGAEEARFLARFSEGRIGKAVRLKSGGTLKKRDAVAEGFNAGNVIMDEDPAFLAKKSEGGLDTFDLLISWYRDIFMLASGADASLVTNADRWDLLREDPLANSEHKARKALAAVIRARSDIEKNVNPKLVMADLVCGIERLRGA